jgi:hypothetical protein
MPPARIAAVAAALTLGAPAPVAAARAPSRGDRAVSVTIVGDSVAASIEQAPRARALLRRGMRTRFDVRVCRRLAGPGCPYQGATPPGALEAVRAAGRALGDVLVVDVGYNDPSAGYRPAMRRIVGAAREQGARAIVWVTLREAGRYRDEYVRTNAAIRAEAARRPRVRVADWNAFSRGRPWFARDGLHLSAAGALGLARFLRPAILRAARRRASPPPQPASARATTRA